MGNVGPRLHTLFSEVHFSPCSMFFSLAGHTLQNIAAVACSRRDYTMGLAVRVEDGRTRHCVCFSILKLRNVDEIVDVITVVL